MDISEPVISMNEEVPEYIALFFSSSISLNSPESFFSLLLLFMARILPIIAMSPFLGARVLPHPVKIALALCLFAIFLPKLLVVTKTPPGFNSLWLLLAAKEFFIGFSLGFIMSTPFSIALNVGGIIDHQRGGASLMVNDPIVQNQASPIGTLFNWILIYIFYVIGGVFLFIEAILTSYDVVPPDQLLSPHFFNKDTTFWQTQLQLLSKVMIISIQLAAPALITILMTDFFLGIANRLAPQVQITFLGMPLKSLLAIMVICLGLKAITDEFVVQLYAWLDTISVVVHSLGTGTI